MEKLRQKILYALTSLVLLTFPTAHGAEFNLNQHGFTGSWYEPRTSGQGFAMEVFPDLLSPGTGMCR